MPLKNLIARYRNNRPVYLALWCIIGLGMIPAIITENISPLDSFSLRFGIETGEIIYLPEAFCLLVFVSGAATCIVQQRYWMMILLLPWLALFFFEVGELTFQLPTKWEAREMLQQNHKRARESAGPPKSGEIRDNLDQIVFSKTDLMKFDKEKLYADLDIIEEKIEDTNPGQEQRAVAIAVHLVTLSTQIGQAEAQISNIRQAMRTTDIISRLSLGLSDKRLKQKLRKGLKKVARHRDRLISQRNARRDDLDAISRTRATFTELRTLGANVKTYLWVSRSYESWYVSLAFSSICFLVLLVLIRQFSLGSWIYLLTVFASLMISVFYVEAPLSYRLWVVVKFAIISLIIRAGYLLLIENYPLIRRQSRAFLLQTLKQTFIYYLPFIALIFLGVVASNQVNKLIDDRLYSVKPMINSDPGDNTRRFDIDKALDAHFDTQEKVLHRRLDKLSKQSSLTVNKVATETVRYYEEAIVETLPEVNEELRPPGCGGFLPWIFKPGQCAENAVLAPVNEGFTQERNDQRDSLRKTAQAYKTRVGKDAQKAIRYAKEDLSDYLLSLKMTIKRQLSLIYSAIDFYTWVSLLVLIMVILKSFMYIFARIFFATDDDDKRVIQFESAAQPVQQGLVEEISDTLELTDGMGEQMYVNKNYDFANAPPDEVTPQASRAFFSRFKNGVWHLNKIKTAARDAAIDTPYRRIPDDERIVVWTLKPGDAVVFSWKTFVGMSDSIQIRAQYSWQLSSLVFGRMFFVVATVAADSPVDGTLLLVARGSDGVRESSNPSNNPDQLLAWQTTTRFQLHASLSFRNVYRSGIQIKARGSDLAVMHLSDKKRKSGATAFLKYFLVPV